VKYSRRLTLKACTCTVLWRDNCSELNSHNIIGSINYSYGLRKPPCILFRPGEGRPPQSSQELTICEYLTLANIRCIAGVIFYPNWARCPTVELVFADPKHRAIRERARGICQAKLMN